MGRAGSGSRSSGSRSSSGHSHSSRSSSGHHVSSSRAGSSRSSSYSGSRSSFYGVSYHRGPGYYGPRTNVYVGPRGCLSNSLSGLIVIFVLFVMVFVIVGNSIGSSGIPASTQSREKLNLGIGYNNNCVIDEINWIDNENNVSKQLQNFYNKTGVQPYVYLKSYDSSLFSDSDKDQWAQDYYENNIDNEGTFLYVYFAEQDTDNDVGYMTTVNGREISSVMDSEAIDIFWAYIDQEWYGDKSTDSLLVDAFNSTAKRIMEKSTSWADIVKYVIIVAFVVIIIVFFIYNKKLKRQHEKERNEETERILNADIHDVGDATVEKYLDEDDDA